MAGKNAILESLRRNRPAPSELPPLDLAATTYANPRAKFIEVLEAVGGAAIIARNATELNEQLARLPHLAAAANLVSLVPGVGSPNVDSEQLDSPHDLANVDVAILPGRFAVAENGAVWVTDHGMRHRALYFLCQHLVLVVPADAVVDHMHAAYQRIAASSEGGKAPFEKPLFGAFISGPSKTADIEQQLVIGAHGPRSIVVCFVESG